MGYRGKQVSLQGFLGHLLNILDNERLTRHKGTCNIYNQRIIDWEGIKLFADDTSLFSVVDDIDVIRRQKWTYQWKMSFNFDRTKPGHGFKFSPKTKNIIYFNLCFKNVSIIKKASQKHI